MTLREVCEVGYACGLTTIQESIFNAELHWDMFTTIIDIDEDFNRLYKECDSIDPEWRMKAILIQNVFPDIHDDLPDLINDSVEGEYPY